jgi:hypothetical protein
MHSYYIMRMINHRFMTFGILTTWEVFISMNIDEVLEDTVELGQEDINRPIYRVDIDKLLDLTSDI